MVELTGSSFLAALVQTAVFLPMFLLSLPAGVLADTTDRRRLILGALAVRPAPSRCWPCWRCSAGPGRRRCCCSPSSPAAAPRCCRRPGTRPSATPCRATTCRRPSPRCRSPTTARARWARRWPASCSRWPARGWVFALAVLSALAMMQAVRRWPPRPHPPSRLPAERLWSGMLSGLRYARHSPTILAQLRAHRRLQRRRLGAVGAAAGDRRSASSAWAPPASAC